MKLSIQICLHHPLLNFHSFTIMLAIKCFENISVRDKMSATMQCRMETQAEDNLLFAFFNLLFMIQKSIFVRHKLYNGNVPFFYLFSPFHHPAAPLLHSFECTQYFMIPENFISTSPMRFMLTKAEKETFKTFDGIKFNESRKGPN